MIGTTRSLRVFAYTEPADLRKGFDGLYGMVTGELGRDPLSGECYLFVNRTRTRAKVLVWDGTGLCVFAKRLEQGRFASLWERKKRGRALELTSGELSLFLEGSELVGRRSLVPAAYVPRTIERTSAL
jgi:transposase